MLPLLAISSGLFRARFRGLYCSGTIHIFGGLSYTAHCTTGLLHTAPQACLLQLTSSSCPFYSSLWKDVTFNLKIRDIDAATEAKHRLEERQRAEARERKEKEIQWETRVSGASAALV